MDSNPATNHNPPHNNNNNNNNEENVILPTSDSTENYCNLPQQPIAPNSLKSITDSNNTMSNQETELLAAMMSEEVAANKAVASTSTSSSSTSFAALPAAVLTTDAYNGSTTTTTTTSTTTTTTTTTMGSGAVAAAATSLGSSNQFVTPQKVSEYKSIVLQLGSASASAQQPQKKKKRNKSSKCLGIGSMHDHDSSSSLSNIKTSLSMTSLPPDEKQESRDGINAKLKVERPYNSLKKNTDRNLTNQLAHMHRAGKNRSGGGGGGNSGSSSNTNSNKHNRYSWGSGHSSSSLHSSAATLGIGSGKDDFWAAIQTNYNYIMDTNLLDTCKEARCEIEGAASVLDITTDTCFKMLDDSSRNVGSCEDPKELRKWLRDMEHKLENAPTLSEATMLTCAELQSHLTVHSNFKRLQSYLTFDE